MQEGRLQAGQRGLVHPNCAGKRVLSQLLDPLRPSENDPCLGAAQQLVPAEADQLGLRLHAFLGRRLVGQLIGCRVEERAAPQVVDEGDPALPSQRYQLFQRRLVGEAHDPKVAPVNPEQRRGLFADGIRVVCDVGPVRGSHLDQPRSALSHDLWDPETPADFHQLTPGDHDLPSPSQGRQDEEQGGGVVVHDQGILGTGKAGQ